MEGQQWQQRYQPVSYLLQSQSGTRDEFTDMVSRCNAVGVRILVDAVFNHMTEQHSEGYGSAGSAYNADSYQYPPFDDDYFFSDRLTCPSVDGVVGNYDNPNEVRDCRQNGRLDLYTAEEPVQIIIASYLNDLIRLGVAGFRVDSATNIWPSDLEGIEGRVFDLSESDGFQPNTRPYFYHDVIAETAGIKPADYYTFGAVTEVLYGKQAAKGLADFTLLQNIYDPALGMAPPENALVFIDSHLSQRDDTIPSEELVTYKTPREYQMATAFMLADDYGVARLMSSYEFSNNTQGPPTDSNNFTLPVTISPDGLCEGGWVCEHRWSPIANMIEFRNAVEGTNRTKFEVLSSGALVLTRGDVGFFAMAPLGVMDEVVDTGLPEGEYFELVGNGTEVITVAMDGSARIIIDDNDVPFIAFCVGSGPETLSTTEGNVNTNDPASTDVPNTDDPFTSEAPNTVTGTDITDTSDISAATKTSTVESTMDITTDMPVSTGMPVTDLSTENPYLSTTDIPTAWPTTDMSTDLPTTDMPTDRSTTDLSTDQPTSGIPTEMSTTDIPTEISTEMSTTDIPTEISTTDIPTEISTTEMPTEMSTTDIPTEMSTTDLPTEMSTTEMPTEMSTTDMSTSEIPTEISTADTTTESTIKRTVVFMHKKVFDDQYVFVRGGINEANHPECGPPAETDSCSLPFTLQSLGTTPNYAKYDAWREGDDYLDWFGSEEEQGQYQGIHASGTPMAWTTNTPGVDGYQELNIYGEDYWMMEFYMDCTLPDEGWFELKGWLEFAFGYTGWELDINQQSCTGAAGGLAPGSSTNHKGRCGYINVFTWNEGSCIVEPFPDTTPTTTHESVSTVEPNAQRTVLFIEQHTVSGQDVFFLGGLGDALGRAPVCVGSDAATDPCSLPITTHSLGTTQHYDGYNDWRKGDDYLDWWGAEDGQGTHNGLPAYGSPAAWTSNRPDSPGYQELNTFGEAFWMLDFDLDCSLTQDGWFEVKGWLSGDAGQFSGLEDDVTQQTCSGTAGDPPPFLSSSHMAKCGHINIFHYDRGDCTINSFMD